MEGSLSTGLRVVFSVVLSCLVIGFVFMIWTSVKDSSNEGTKQVNNAITQMGEAEYLQYDGTTVTGSEVINFIRQHSKDEIYVYVDNGSTGGATYYIHSYNEGDSSLSSTSADIKIARKKGTSTYIAPSSMFDAEVVRDKTTGEIIGMEFKINSPGSEGNLTE